RETPCSRCASTSSGRTSGGRIWRSRGGPRTWCSRPWNGLRTGPVDERSRDGGPPRRARRPLEEDRLVARGLGEKRLGSGEHLAQPPSRDRLELERVVRADEANLRPMLRLELPQAALVPPARAAVLLHEPLVEAQAWWATGTADVQLAVPEV